mmetsp:Transcript_81162/g.216884  ORF Transcript_81162/g.216884 Transcript_81162/m.216884 type:complete len:254 (+) Transcript_81162:783-1544(+)
MEDEQHVQGLHKSRVRLVLGGSLMQHVQHVQEVLHVPQIRVGGHIGPPDAVAVGDGSNGRAAAQNAHNLLVAQGEVLVAILARQSRVGLGVQRPLGRQSRHQHPHGVRIVPECLMQLVHVVVDHRMAHDVPVPLRKLRGRGKLTVDQQVRDLHKAGLLGKLLNWVPAVPEDPLVPINKRNFRNTAGRVHVPRVVGLQGGTVRALHLLQVVGLDCVVRDGQGVALPCPIVRHGDGVIGPGHRVRDEAAGNDVPC